MQGLRTFWGKGTRNKLILIVAGAGGLFSICCVLLVVVALLSPSPPRTAAAPTTGSVAQAATTAPATTGPTQAPPTEGPTNTPQPTNTPEPPTAVPTDTPIPATPTPIPPVVLEGRGQTVTDKFQLPASVSRAILKHSGRRNFIVTAYRNGEQADLLANKIGSYSGIRPLIGDGEWYLEVQADGAWSVTIEAITGQPDAAQGIEGSGDFVSGVFEPAQTGAVPYNIKHTGERNFIVYLDCAGGQDLVENVIGPVDGSVVAQFPREGPCLWDVQADGEWSIKPK